MQKYRGGIITTLQKLILLFHKPQRHKYGVVVSTGNMFEHIKSNIVIATKMVLR